MYPVLFEFGPVKIYTYGALLALAFWLSVRFSVKNGVKFRGFKEEEIYDLAVISVLGALMGARIAYIVIRWDYYMQNPFEILQVWKGGLVFYGGLLGGFGAGCLYWFKKGHNIFSMADVAATAVSLGQSVGRLGCFCYGCCYGVAIDAHSHFHFLGVHFPGHEVLRHPTQIYSAFANFLIFLFLSSRLRREKVYGMVVVWYLYVYGTFRFLIEFIRDDFRGNVPFFPSLSTSQGVALFGFFCGILLHVWLRRKRSDPS